MIKRTYLCELTLGSAVECNQRNSGRGVGGGLAPLLGGGSSRVRAVSLRRRRGRRGGLLPRAPPAAAVDGHARFPLGLLLPLRRGIAARARGLVL